MGGLRNLDRRRFLRALGAVLAWPALGGIGLARPAWAQGLLPESKEKGRDEDRFAFAQLRYRGGEWDPNPLAFRALLDEVTARTSVEASSERKILTPASKEVFSYPFLYQAGRDAFEPWSEEERDNLRTFLENGGTLLADDSVGRVGAAFDAAFREEMRRMFPRQELRRLPSDHTVFRSFYLVRHVGGRRIVHPYLEGIQIGDVTPVVYCQNDLGGAWEKDPAGNWVYPCEPGGEPQRREAFKLGVNIVLYALTSNYKQDQIHLPFIKRRVG
ncbi:MAG: DUF4159 domain-containing protein [Candidatus Tectomicrobia bacterium]|nr:DUF4159 domain-containing protein [Candidatus Tectomicrobia bacterium]